VKKQELTICTHKNNTDFIIILQVFSSKCFFIETQKMLGAEWWTWKTFLAVRKKILSMGLYGAHDILLFQFLNQEARHYKMWTDQVCEQQYRALLLRQIPQSLRKCVYK
jgi:hypothetical protein